MQADLSGPTGLEMAAPRRPTKARWSWRSRTLRGLLVQWAAVAVVGLAVGFLAHNTLQNMSARGIQAGFDFLAQPAGFDIGESPIAFDSGRSYGRAFAVGLANTLRVAALGVLLTTVLGTLLGLGRLSRNALLRGVCVSYIEVFRNTPLLLQLLMWYLLLTALLPSPSEAWQAGPFFLSKGGVAVPWLAGGHELGLFDLPRQGTFAVEGGASLTPEFMAVLLGLTLYTAAFVAEVVRAGVQSVARGPVEAAHALGLNRYQVLRLVVVPQALRVIVPPLTNQYLNLTKHSSLGVAIGYPEVVSIANTALNQTGRAVECISLVMLVYLTTSLTTSALMNRYTVRELTARATER
jgi:general L-amino acid transport system permease protein